MWSPIRSGDGNLEGKGKWNHLILNHLLLKVIQSPALFSANWINQLFTNRSELIARQKIYAHAARWPRSAGPVLVSLPIGVKADYYRRCVRLLRGRHLSCSIRASTKPLTNDEANSALCSKLRSMRRPIVKVLAGLFRLVSIGHSRDATISRLSSPGTPLKELLIKWTTASMDW